MLGELTGRGIGWLTLRQRGKAEIARLAALPANQWKTVTITRSGRYRRPQLHEDMIRLKGLDTKVRQIAVTQHRPRRTHPAHQQRPHHPPPKTCSPATPNA